VLVPVLVLDTAGLELEVPLDVLAVLPEFVRSKFGVASVFHILLL
jgi:hypothetical protein